MEQDGKEIRLRWGDDGMLGRAEPTQPLSPTVTNGEDTHQAEGTVQSGIGSDEPPSCYPTTTPLLRFFHLSIPLYLLIYFLSYLVSVKR